MATKKTASRKRRKVENRPNAKASNEGAALISVRKSSRITGLSESLSYELANNGTLPCVTIRGRKYVHVPRLMQWLNGGEAA